MDIVLLAKSDVPLYEQIYDQLASQILSGKLAAQSCLPSIRTVARELGIGIITVKKAYELLEERELVYTVAGKGCFVAAHAEGALADRRMRLAEERLAKDYPFYRELGLTAEELAELIRRSYG